MKQIKKYIRLAESCIDDCEFSEFIDFLQETQYECVKLILEMRELIRSSEIGLDAKLEKARKLMEGE